MQMAVFGPESGPELDWNPFSCTCLERASVYEGDQWFDISIDIIFFQFSLKGYWIGGKPQPPHQIRACDRGEISEGHDKTRPRIVDCGVFWSTTIS
jgi:hypothetical protein